MAKRKVQELAGARQTLGFSHLHLTFAKMRRPPPLTPLHSTPLRETKSGIAAFWPAYCIWPKCL